MYITCTFATTKKIVIQDKSNNVISQVSLLNIAILHMSSSVKWTRLKKSFPPAVPKITPANVSGGGGSRSELVITWEVR